jgi:hypothetical protein
LSTRLIRELRKTGDCWVHGHHAPQPHTFAFHHIIPREWQRQWNPTNGRTTNWSTRHKLWAPDVVGVCPTGHANIHHWIRRIRDEVKIVAISHARTDDAWEKVYRYYKPIGANRRELLVAKQAFINWIEAGGPWEFIL